LLDELSTNSEVRSLTFRDLTVDCSDNYLTDLRSGNPATIRFENVRVVGFDMGAGGSVMLAARRAAFFASGCRFEAGYGRSPGSGNLFRVRSGLLARIEDSVFVGPFRSVFDTHDNELERPEDYINHSLYFEAKTFLHGLFVVEDKLSMAHSLEARVPFMDNDLVDFAMRCPVSLKLNKLDDVVRVDENEIAKQSGKLFRNSNDGKQILRDMMAHYIPEDITKAQKQGFSSPDASWFKGESIDFVREKLCGTDARLFDVLDRATIQSLVGDHLEGKENRRLLIWSLLNVNEYLEQVL